MNAPVIQGFTRFLRGLRFGQTSRLRMWQLLSQFLQTEMDLREAIYVAGSSLKIRGRIYEAVAEDLLEGLRTGDLEERLFPYCSPIERILFLGLDEKGAGRVLEGAVTILNMQSRIRSAILANIFLPVILISGLLAIVVIYGLKVHPAITAIVPVENLSSQMQLFAWVSLGIVENWPTAIAAMLLSFLSLRFSTTHLSGPLRRALVILPPYSLYEIQSSATLASLCVQLHEIGQNISSSTLMRVAEISSPYEADKLQRLSDDNRGFNSGKGIA